MVRLTKLLPISSSTGTTSSSWLQLASKACIVTGAGSGIGEAVTKSLVLDHNCRVVLVDKNIDALNKVAEEITDQQCRWRRQLGDSGYDYRAYFMKPVECDVTDSKQVMELMRTADRFAAESVPGGDKEDDDDDDEGKETTRTATIRSPPAATVTQLLVNCAGITRDDFVGRMSEKDYDDVLNVNLKATWLLCRHFCDQQRMQQLFPPSTTKAIDGSQTSSLSRLASDYGSIVNVGSIVSEVGNVGQTNYAASKGGVLGLTRALAKEMAYRNVRVNAVVPGFIDTPMARAVPDHIKDRIVTGIPLKRFGTPAEVADTVAFLLSPRSSYITGELIRVSGMISL
jgi:NAD(P)-dependent dehydrogenase (short-subunit alcohol dehydrogenase family)